MCVLIALIIFVISLLGITQFTAKQSFKDTDCNVSQAAEDLFSPLAGTLSPQCLLDILTPMVSQGSDTSSLRVLKKISKVMDKGTKPF